MFVLWTCVFYFYIFYEHVLSFIHGMSYLFCDGLVYDCLLFVSSHLYLSTFYVFFIYACVEGELHLKSPPKILVIEIHLEGG